MYAQPVKIPFLNEKRERQDSGYFDMIKNRFFPHFQLVSFTTFLILLNIFVFLITRIMFSPSKYNSFLEWPTQMDKWLLDVELVKSNRVYLYQVVTALFMHSNYLHIVGNMIFALFVMYEIQYCWKAGIIWGLIGGIAANCLAIICLQGRFLGFSGVLCCYFGMFLGTIFVHCNYLQEKYKCGFWMIVLMVIFMGFMLVGFASSALVHLFGFTFGILIGVALFPRMQQSQLSPTMDKIFTFGTYGILVLVIVLAIII